MYEDEMYEDEKLRRCIKCRQIPLIVAIGTFSVECDKDGFFMGNLDSVAGHELKYRVFASFVMISTAASRIRRLKTQLRTGTT